MNIKELTSGDWVIRKNVPNEYLKVIDILTYRKLVFTELDGLGVMENIEDLDGIPLTQKILELNGFIEIDKDKVKETATHVYMHIEDGEQEDGFAICGNDTNGYYLGIYLNQYPTFVGKHRVSNDPNLMSYVYPVYNAKYVHQLQNILTNFGIEKEIIL